MIKYVLSTCRSQCVQIRIFFSLHANVFCHKQQWSAANLLITWPYIAHSNGVQASLDPAFTTVSTRVAFSSQLTLSALQQPRDIETMLDQRLRRWTSNKPTLGQCLVFSGSKPNYFLFGWTNKNARLPDRQSDKRIIHAQPISPGIYMYKFCNVFFYPLNESQSNCTVAGSWIVSINHFKPEFTIVIFIHYKPGIAVAIFDL